MTSDSIPLPPLDDPPRKTVRRWPAFLVGLLLGAGIATGVVLSLWKGPEWFHPPPFTGFIEPGETITSKPSNEEVLEYLDGKSFAVPQKDSNAPASNVVIKGERINELKWTSGSRIGGSENPWENCYSVIYLGDGADYLLDVRISTRVVGSRRAFLGAKFEKVTPVEKIVTPKK